MNLYFFSVSTQRLKKLEEKYSVIGEVRGYGLMAGIDLTIDPITREPATKLAKQVSGIVHEPPSCIFASRQHPVAGS